MIWIAVFLLLSSTPFFPYLLMKEPARPSPGSLGYLDRAFVDWTSRLVHRGLLDDDHWLLECPGYLCGCCPPIKRLDDDQEILNQLTDMSPAHAFAYAITRRFAEVVVRLSSCWLLAGLFLVLAFSTCRTWQVSIRQDAYGKNMKITGPTWWNPKNVCLLFSIVLLSILAPTLAEKAFSGFIDYQLEMLNGRSVHSPSFSILKPWKVRHVKRQGYPLSLLHLLDFVRLHQSLYSLRTNHSPAATSCSPLCRQTALSLSCWSVLVFVGTAYAVVTVAFRALVWRPMKSLFSGLATNKSTQNRTLTSLAQAERNHLHEACSQEILDLGVRRSYSALDFTSNRGKEDKSPKATDKLSEQFDQYTSTDPEITFSEKGDSKAVVAMAPNIRERSNFQRPESGDHLDAGRTRRLPVRPRYVSRGVYACLDSVYEADEYALRD